MTQPDARIHPVYAAMDQTIFDVMSGLSRDLGAINLGQGFPDEIGPPDLLAAAARALTEKSNQYPPIGGLPELRDAVAAFYARRQGLELTREQLTITSGATEAIADAVLALISPGDEVILFQPAYDAYAPLVRRAGGVPVSVPLAPPDWHYRADALAAAVTPRTRAVMLNDPLNPAGTCASHAELAMLAEACVAHDLVVIADEVWEDVRFEGAPHRSIMTFPGMAERTVKIGSAGKIFGVTGWKIGWMVAAPALSAGLFRAHQFVTATSAPALQWAVAEGLGYAQSWFDARTAAWAASRARLKAGLEAAGFHVLPNQATWFLCVDLVASGIALDDRTFSERLIREAGVASIPLSALFEASPGLTAPSGVVRFCFTKPDAMLDEAVARIGRFRASLSR